MHSRSRSTVLRQFQRQGRVNAKDRRPSGLPVMDASRIAPEGPHEAERRAAVELVFPQCFNEGLNSEAPSSTAVQYIGDGLTEKAMLLLR